MSSGFFKWPLKLSFSGSAEQEAPSAITTHHAWLDALLEHPPTPDEPVKEFEAYFACVEEAVRARQHVAISPSGRVRPSSPIYNLADEDAAQKTEAIFRSVFEHEGWSEHTKERMHRVWMQVPDSLKKMSFKTEESMATPATIYRTADALISGERKHSADVIDLEEFRHHVADAEAVEDGALVLRVGVPS